MTNSQENKNSNELDDALRELEKMRGQEDLIFLMEEILNYPKMGKIHRRVEKFLRKVKQNKKKGIVLLPRNHLKTTQITICWTIQQLLNNPDLRIFITNERLENAKSFLREIKTHFEKNEKLRFLYGNLVNEKEKWTETQIILKTRKINRKEPTIQTGSVDTSLVSQHYDIILADDLVSRNNTKTREQREKVIQYWKDLLSLLEPTGTIIDIGTRWNFDDLHGWLIKQKGFETMIVSCFDSNGDPIFPEKFTRQDLLTIKTEIGTYDFSCLYNNNPTDDETADFKRSWFENRYLPKEIAGKQMNAFVTIDNAPSTKKGTDWIGIIVNLVDRENRWYFDLVLRFKGNTPALINKMFEINEQYHPIQFGVEQKAFEDLIKPYLDEEMRKRNQFFSCVELKDKGTRKEERIRGRLQPRFNSGAIFLKADATDNTEDLVDELIRFPFANNDDLSDSAQYQEEIAYKPDKQDEEEYGIYDNEQNYD